ncbi:DUF2849 domain-containing protein [Parvularcula lutaonensis]|uniref:DUF2849 domain-containing protein n=1 Tax=Parvularcula lutaonensis TaxID=491923 RepID=A0ABV7M9G8_9PROT|nr:DUF2849 domain-containing protein [Parvularcula lutaonensis]GGY46734.1 hypothetical protein GCM10007148_14830 [Parvularcula lutaonensis]
MSQTEATPRAAEQPVKISAGGVKKAKAAGTKVITANDLFSGAVVYWKADGSWTEELDEAQILEGPAALDALQRAVADEANAVGPYLMDVEDDHAPAGRGRLRETIRKAGPTIHPQFGRQAQRL